MRFPDNGITAGKDQALFLKVKLGGVTLAFQAVFTAGHISHSLIYFTKLVLSLLICSLEGEAPLTVAP